jgi:hypothetical protein
LDQVESPAASDQEDSDEEEVEEVQEATVLGDQTNSSKYTNSKFDGSVVSKSYSKEMKTRSGGKPNLKASGSKEPASKNGSGGSKSNGKASKSNTQRTSKHKPLSTTIPKQASKRKTDDIYSASDASGDDRDAGSVTSSGGGDVSFKRQYEAERRKNEQHKIRERTLQDTILSGSRSKKGKQKTFFRRWRLWFRMPPRIISSRLASSLLMISSLLLLLGRCWTC